MKKTVLLLFALLVALPASRALAGEGCSSCASSAKAAAPAVPAAPAADGVVIVTPADVKKLLDSKEPVVLVDARSGKYDDGRRIGDALSLNAKSDEKEIAKLLPDKDAKIVAYCANLKCPAGPEFARHLKKLGYKNVHELPVGIDGWVEAGHPVKEPAKK